MTPTRFAAFRACQLRTAWEAAPGPRPLPLTPKAEVGSVGHKLLEDAAAGKLASTGEAGAEWDARIACAEARCRTSRVTAGLVPFSALVHEIGVTKRRVLARVAELLESPRTEGFKGPSVEVWLETADKLVGGRVDSIVHGPEGAILRDYKTGPILSVETGDDAAKARQGQIKEAYRLQMLLYAALHAEARGEWPYRVELVPLSGESIEVPFSPAEAESLLAEARSMLLGFNALVDRHADNPSELEETLWSPSPEGCRFCVFRPVCRGYAGFRERDDGDRLGLQHDAWGTLVQARRLGNGRAFIEVRRQRGVGDHLTVRGLGSRHDFLLKTVAGAPIGLFNLVRESDSSFREGPYTVIYLCSSEQSPAPQCP